jgi:hypothetical protein
VFTDCQNDAAHLAADERSSDYSGAQGVVWRTCVVLDSERARGTFHRPTSVLG